MGGIICALANTRLGLYAGFYCIIMLQMLQRLCVGMHCCNLFPVFWKCKQIFQKLTFFTFLIKSFSGKISFLPSAKLNYRPNFIVLHFPVKITVPMICGWIIHTHTHTHTHARTHARTHACTHTPQTHTQTYYITKKNKKKQHT